MGGSVECEKQWQSVVPCVVSPNMVEFFIRENEEGVNVSILIVAGMALKLQTTPRLAP